MIIRAAPITQLRTYVMGIVHVQVQSHYMGNQLFPATKDFSKRKEFFPLRQVSFMKRDANDDDDDRCAFQ